ncbi:MAG: hypothetical protein IPI59_08275 [Sphingobacteriales bacterium]|jgi:hypothetical protein|nr:hypothetical protein [Sphingobacteriales bacterium]MBP9140084.1 hypothetical protein [Chitinophagales bacterium]MDA0197833.1 hypothetical protein [Bacteroidota bacterium]MBK6889945.1 hypothetical protein [Sphingobacteriales bacterium]MBK7527531.1 hypothetical protein [Sphingobacteriales bacterium]
MTPYLANLINGAVCVVMGLWGYTTTHATTALIAPILGLVFLACTKGFRTNNKIIVHVVVVLTLLLLIALIKPLTGALNDNDTSGLIRIGVMLLTNAVALVVFIKSFIDVRRNRNTTGQ